jgi:pyochelin biosynthetic protein PchG
VNAVRPVRVVVCGTTFGQFYIEALSKPDSGMQLAGIVARGSEASHACARAYGVPLFTALEQLHDVDAACVVVRAGILGGNGTQLAGELMRRGIHVLQEHPLHHAELAECLRTARRNHVGYRLNAFYVHLEPVRRFIAAAGALVRETPARFVDAACGFQLVHSTLEIIAEALGGVRPWRLDAAPAVTPGAPFRSLSGVLGGVPVTLRVQNQLDPNDPDNFAHIMHRITVGTDDGNVMLASTNGPVLWSPRLHVRRETRIAPSLRGGGGDDAGAGAPAVVTLGSQRTESWDELFRSAWPAAAARAVCAFGDAVAAGEDPMRRGQRDLTLCSLAEDVSAQLGPPELVHGEPPRPFAAERLAAAFREPDLERVS